MMGELVSNAGGEQGARGPSAVSVQSGGDRYSELRLRTLSSPRVLIVDDDRADRRYLTRRLKNANLGFHVIAFPSGDAALEQLDLIKPDCVLLDIHLPGMSGLEFVHRMQVLYGSLTPSVIAITGDESQRVGVDSIKQGVAEVVAKGDLEDIDLPALVLRTIGSRRHHQAALSQKLAAFNQLVAGTAHRVNNPAAIARLTLCSIHETLDSWVEEGAPQLQDVPRLLNLARTADEALSRIANVIRELQGQAGTSLGHVHRLTLSRAVELARPGIERCEQAPCEQVVFSLESTATIVGDPAQLSRVIVDLVENAIEADARKVTVRTWDEANFVNVTVEDDGPGIPVDEHELIFDPLYTTHADRGALGMGLARASLIARRHGGTIAIECPLTGGTRLHLRFPRPLDSRPQPWAKPVGKKMAHRPKILILEGEPEIRAHFFRILEAHYQVETASTASEARAAIDREFFEVIISDVELAGEGGVAFARRLMRTNANQAARIVFSAGGIVDHEAAAFVQRWENGCIRKPVSPDALKNHLATFLSAFYPEDDS